MAGSAVLSNLSDYPHILVYGLVVVLLIIGAFHLLPPIVKQAFNIIKEVLETFGDFLKWYRTWKQALWPSKPSASGPPASPAEPSVADGTKPDATDVDKAA